MSSMNKNCAEFFPILMYKDGKITRINGSKNIISGSYTLLPLFSVDQFPDYTIEMAAAVNRSTVGVRCTVMELQSALNRCCDCRICGKRYCMRRIGTAYFCH